MSANNGRKVIFKYPGANGLFKISYGESNTFPSEKQVKFRRVLTEINQLALFLGLLD